MVASFPHLTGRFAALGKLAEPNRLAIDAYYGYCYYFDSENGGK
jgi:hypothetical protein